MIKTKELAEILGVQEVTVRKYASQFDKVGHQFERDDNKYRMFNDKDVELFKRLMSIRQETNMSVLRCAESALQQQSEPIPSVSASLDEHMTQEVARLHKRLDDMQATMQAVLRESAELRRMFAEKNGRRWWEFWKKNLVLPDLSDPETVWKLRKSLT